MDPDDIPLALLIMLLERIVRRVDINRQMNREGMIIVVDADVAVLIIVGRDFDPLEARTSGGKTNPLNGWT